jgi:hypothetical protein
MASKDVLGGAGSPSASAAAPAPAPAFNSGSKFDRDEIIEIIAKLKKMLSDITGFDVQDLTMDLFLKEDLGMDSFKRREFFSNVSHIFNIP